MKKLIAIAIAATALAGCGTVEVNCEGDGKWNAKVRNSWLRRDIDGFEANIEEGGKFSVKLNAVKSDVSEQLPTFTREMWAGLGILGRIAATAVNPAASAVPLTAEPADADKVSALVKASAEAKAALASAKAELAKAKAELAAAQAAQTTEAECSGGDCEK